MTVVLQLLINALITGAIYALAASGLSFIYATTRVFHFGHGAVIALGAYALWWLHFENGITPLLAVPLTIALCTLVGLAMNALVYEPLRRRQARGFTTLIAALALLMLGDGILLGVFGSQPHSVALPSTVLSWNGLHMTSLQLGIVGVAVVTLTLLMLFVRFTKFGQAMRAVADNETVAMTLGINAPAVRRWTFAIGSALAAVAGMLFLLELNIEPETGVTIVIKAFAAMVVGGVGTMGGVVAGSLLLSGAEQTSAWFFGAGWKSAVGFILLFIFLLVRPHGIFGHKRHQ